jgi:hypothetical protein
LWNNLRISSRRSWVEGEISVGGFMVRGTENRWLWYHLLATSSWIEERERRIRER